MAKDKPSDKEKHVKQFAVDQFTHLTNMISALSDDNDPFGDRRAKLSRALGYLALTLGELVSLPEERQPTFRTAAEKAKYDSPAAASPATAAAAAAPAAAPEAKRRRGRKPAEAANSNGNGEGGTSIDTLGLGTRAFNCLKKKKILTVEKLVTMDEAALLKLPRFGKTCLEDVQKRLKKAGRSLGEKAATAHTATAAAPATEEEPEPVGAGSKLPW